MRSYGLSFGISVLALMASSAFAQTPLAPPVPQWSGFYGGLHLGYGAGRDDVREINGNRSYFPDTKGAILGVQGGWQKQIDRFVFGAELEAGTLGQSGDVTRRDEGGTLKSSTDFGLYGTLSGRVGYTVTPDWLVYGRLGLTLAEMDAKIEQSCPAQACAWTPSSSATRDHAWGYVFGGGVEHSLSDRWTGRIEYQYTDFRRELALPAGESGPGWHHDPDLHAVKFSMNRRF